MTEEQTVLEAVEEVVDSVEETLDTVIRVNVVKAFFSKPAVKLTALCAVSFGAGVGVSYFVLSKKLETKYAQLAQEEIDSVKRSYAVIRDAPQFSTPEEAVAAVLGEKEVVEVDRIINEQAYKSTSEWTPPVGADTVISVEETETITVDVEADPIRQNLFERNTPQDDTTWDYETELAKRDPETPYVIHQEEFYANETDYEQTQFIYYAGDMTLADEADQIVGDLAATVGEHNLERFGVGTDDENVVHVRNDVIEVDFEITRSTGKYRDEVAGLSVEEDVIAHSDRPGIRRFRDRE